ncbi:MULTISPECIES: MATE family efflux transporter [Cyanophyceae]|uniref:MATE family efflux transporter n=1 Tax=Cyanophyceae TaxID=3028117 RepID=UPI0016846C26|nr:MULTISPECIES: MATE family efflux transporter [Cyanophyceae]MBD1916927.1 MATE family efflux transporter [Phormidium sp. FACHB-77]MBD2029933.1 MATE family efflux transporter [Phormidium sp. FACHB-322]MBD2053128.1 MATE family efflux transporter [Leptolyngbya sp. FACHB-60]
MPDSGSSAPKSPATATHASAFLPSFLKLAVANIISNLMVPLAALVDTAFLGHLDDISHLGGVALATVIFNVAYWSFGFLRMGTTGTTAQARGRGDAAELWLILLRNGAIALGFGVVILLLQVPIRDVGFALLSAEPDVRAAGMAFYNARIWDAPAVLMNLVLMGWFLGREKGRRVIVLSMVGNGSNVVFNTIFINLLGWASTGAGLGTALSQYVTLAVGLSLLVREGGLQKLWAVVPQGRNLQAIKGLFLLNRDILVRTFALVLCFALFTNFSSALGTETLAANTLLLQVVTLSAYFIDGIAFATESFAGRYYGSGDRTHLRRLLSIGGSTSVVLGLTFALTFVLFPAPLFGLLTGHQDVIAIVKTYVGWLIPVLGLGAIAYMLDGYFLGLTAGPVLRNATVLAAGVGFLPLAFLAQSVGSVHLLWLALVGLMAARALTLLWAVPKSLT